MTDFWTSNDASRAASAAEEALRVARSEARRQQHRDDLDHQFRYDTDPTYRGWWNQRQERLAREAHDRFIVKVCAVGALVALVVFLLLPTVVKIGLLAVVVAAAAHRFIPQGSGSGRWWAAPHNGMPLLVLSAAAVWIAVIATG